MTAPAEDDVPAALLSRRVDDLGRAFKGSQMQVQIYVNRRGDELERKLRNALPTLESAADTIEWVSPLEAARFAEYQDQVFLRAVQLERLEAELARFWPGRGPAWDGLARVRLRSRGDGVLLLEGKSHPRELYGGGCAARADESKRLIRIALERTQAWLGLPVDPDRWLGSLYQSANRLAHLYFLREVASVDAWLVHACFIDDIDHVPIGEAEWRRGLGEAPNELGLAEATPYAGAAFLPARPRADLD